MATEFIVEGEDVRAWYYDEIVSVNSTLRINLRHSGLNALGKLCCASLHIGGAGIHCCKRVEEVVVGHLSPMTVRRGGWCLL